LTLITPGTIYPGYNVELSADLAPDTAAKPYDYTIDYGDGNVESGSSSTDPFEFSHAYTDAGIYTVQFTAQNAVMPEPLSASIDVTITPTPAAPMADFTSNTPVKLGLPVVFTNLTTGTHPITYAWDFGDGVGTSTLANPTYTYAEVGIYTVTLVATNPGGTSTVTHMVVIIESMYRLFLPLVAK
jgi:PKD repeat protein